jgi:hypothetical protein
VPRRVPPRIRKRRPGGGRKPGPSKRVLTERINLRVTPKLRARLDDAADKADQSLAVEVTRRLEASFGRQRSPQDAEHLIALTAAVEHFVVMEEQKTGAAWNKDAATLERLCGGLPTLIDALATMHPGVTRLDPDKAKEAQRAGAADAGELVSALNMLRSFLPKQIWPPANTNMPLYDILWNLNKEGL